jgi:hypothetical protein
MSLEADSGYTSLVGFAHFGPFPPAARALNTEAAKEGVMTAAQRYLASALLVFLAGLTAACATATYGYRARGTVYVRQDVTRIAFDYGYRDGLDYGRRDARDRHRYSSQRRSYERLRPYRNADRGYRREYGDRRFYQKQYRAGFARGYAEAFPHDSYQDDFNRRDRRDRDR